MDTLAILLASLKQFHRTFVIKMMDALFEEMIRGIERNDFKES